MNKLVLSKWLMIAAIFVIACFQAYWLKQLYNDEFKNLKTQTDVLLKQSVQELENKKLKSDSAFIALLNKQANASQIINNNTKLAPSKNFVAIKTPTTVAIKHEKSAEKKLKKDSITTQVQEKPVFLEPGNSKRVITIRSNSDGSTIGLDSILNKLDPSKIKSIHVIKDSSINITSRSFTPNEVFLKKHSSDDTSLRSVSFIKSYKAITKDTVVARGNNMIKITANMKLDSGKTFNFSGLFIKLLTDTLPYHKVDSAFKKQLQKDKVNIPFALVIKTKNDVKDTLIPENKLSTNFVSSGIIEPIMYKAEFKNPFKHIAKKLVLPFSLSLFLLGFVTTAFIFLYKNMKAQHKLSNMKNEFISNITHELKTPISTVSVAIEAMRNFNALNNPQKTKEYLDISASEITRLSLLVDNVLKLSMFENDKIELDKQSFDIVQLINEILNALSIQFEQHQAIIEFQPSKSVIQVHADKLHLSSVLFNLLDNAIKYSKNQPIIFVSVEQLDGRIEISVKDQGIGIDKQHQEKIFNKFFRVSQGVDRHNVKGYGLGLSYVFYIVKKHNGNIYVKSEANKGSTFIISLPS